MAMDARREDLGPKALGNGCLVTCAATHGETSWFYHEKCQVHQFHPEIMEMDGGRMDFGDPTITYGDYSGGGIHNQPFEISGVTGRVWLWIIVLLGIGVSKNGENRVVPLHCFPCTCMESRSKARKRTEEY